MSDRAEAQTSAAEAERRAREALASRAKRLDLRSLGLTTLPEVVLQCSVLEELDVSHNAIARLPEDLDRLPQLRQLLLGFNRIEALPGSIVNLHRLRVLALEANGLTSVPAIVLNLSTLHELNLANNLLGELPESLSWLAQLRSLDVSHNRLTRLPAAIRSLPHLETLFLHGNPTLGLAEALVSPSKRERHNAKQIIESYFASHSARLREARLVVLSTEGTDTTALIAALLRRTATPPAESAHDIAVTAWPVHVSGERITLSVWDCSSSRLPSTLQRMLIARRSLYLLFVADSGPERQAEIEHLLQSIEMQAPQCPVILAHTQPSDPGESALDKLQALHPAIRAGVFLGSNANDNLDALREAIAHQVHDLGHLRESVPVIWLAVKQQLEQLSDNHIDAEQYGSICTDNGVVKDADQQTLASLLTELGVFLHFTESDRLRSLYVRKPDWIVAGMHLIFETARSAPQQSAEVDLDQLAHKAPTAAYPRDKLAYLLDVLKHFELAVEFEEQPGTYLISPALPARPSDSAEINAGTLCHEYRYAVIPEVLIARLIARTRVLHQHLAGARWRDGALLEWRGVRAQITFHTSDRCLRIAIAGTASIAQTLLGIIRMHLDSIHAALGAVREAQGARGLGVSTS
jgi:hypothetical protein